MILIYFLVNTVLITTGLVFYFVNIESIGSSLIAAGISGYIIYWAIFVNEKKTKSEIEILNTLREFGILNFYDRRLLYSEYGRACKKTKENLDILGFGLHTFIEDNKEKLNSWSIRFKIRILVLNPKNANCNQRDYEEDDPEGKLKNDIFYITKIILDLNNPRVKIKWYSAIPITNMLRMDEIMWVGPYFIKERSRNAYVITLSKNGFLFDKYLSHFEKIWDDPKLSYEPTKNDIQKLS